MKMGPSGWRRMFFSVLVLALSSRVGVAQYEPVSPRNASQSSSAGPADEADWYALPPCDADADFGMPLPAARGILGNSAAGAKSGFFGGADFLLIRPHFSEAVAFARGTLGPASFNATAEPLDFDYDASLRATFGYRSAQGDTELRFTYWHIESDTAVAAGNPGPGQFIVDPFGNLVGTAVVIDPTDARGLGTFLVGGASIATTSSVGLNVFDLDLKIDVTPQNPSWSVDFTAGVRIAEVDQFYDSVIRDAGGNLLTRGDFTVDFVGAGPSLGSGIRRIFGRDRQFTAFAQGSGALLLGEYDVAFSNSLVVPPGPFQGSQSQSMTRLMPVVDTEVGGSWRMADRLTVSGGWLFQGWFDFGTSGGKFDGFFSGADDSNIMSFDGLFLRAEMAF